MIGILWPIQEIGHEIVRIDLNSSGQRVVGTITEFAEDVGPP